MSKLFDEQHMGEGLDGTSFLTSLLQSATEYAVVATDLTSAIVLCSEGAHRLYGFLASEALGKTVSRLLDAPADVEPGQSREIMEIALRDGKWESITQRLRNTKKPVTVRVVVTPLRKGAMAASGFVMISKDVSAEARVNEGARRMRQLIDDLLNYSKLVVDRSPRRLESVDLNEIVEAARANCEAGLDESGATILCEPLAKVQGYPDQLLQLLQNLIGNAVRYGRAEAPPVIRISGRSVESEYLVDVEDNGIGLKMESSESIFRLFTRLHGREVPGTGVGLAICKRAVENHGGRIWVDSVVGEGSTFHFSLPDALP